MVLKQNGLRKTKIVFRSPFLILFLLMVWGIQQNFLSRQTENTFCRDKGNKYFPIYTTP